MKLFALAAAMAAFACPAFAEEAKPSPAVQKLELAVEAPYWAFACEREYMARPGLAASVYGYTIGALSAMSRNNQPNNVADVLKAIGEMGEEGIADKAARKFSSVQCERLVADFAESWQSL